MTQAQARAVVATATLPARLTAARRGPPIPRPSAASRLSAGATGSVIGSGATPATSDSASVPLPATITGAGTLNFVPLFTGAATVGNSALFQSGASPTAKIGINTSVTLYQGLQKFNNSYGTANQTGGTLYYKGLTQSAWRTNSLQFFTNGGPSTNNQYWQAAFNTSPGKLAPFQPTSTGGMLLYVKEKLPVNTAKMETDLPAYVSNLRATRQNEAFNDWLRKEAEKGLRDTPVGRPTPPPAMGTAAKS